MKAHQPDASRGLPIWGALLIAAVMLASTPFAEILRPSHRTASARAPLQLDRQVPSNFAGWIEDRSILPVLPDPQLQATLDATYTQVLARTYVDDQGRQVMLSIAYGNDQSSEATAVHRPEFCYRSQGFDVSDAGTSHLVLPGRELVAQHLIAQFGARFEPITYWVTLDETATLPGVRRKIAQIRYGLRGLIVDGMLVRISTVGLSREAAFLLQQRFAADLYQALPPDVRARYFGS